MNLKQTKCRTQRNHFKKVKLGSSDLEDRSLRIKIIQRFRIKCKTKNNQALQQKRQFKWSKNDDHMEKANHTCFGSRKLTIINSRSPSRWKDDKDNLQINLLEDNDDISLASRETDTLASDLFKKPSGSYAGDTPVSSLR